VNVAIATTIVWISLRLIDESNPIWAIASMVASSDPQPVEARRLFKARIINVLVGCAIGLLFIVSFGTDAWVLPIALATSVLISSYVIRIKTMWRQAPIPAAIIIAAGITHHSTTWGIENGIHKVIEVIFGCLVGLCISWLMSKVWIIKLQQ
jgi:uncharacterized membrane protein YccC